MLQTLLIESRRVRFGLSRRYSGGSVKWTSNMNHMFLLNQLLDNVDYGRSETFDGHSDGLADHHPEPRKYRLSLGLNLPDPAAADQADKHGATLRDGAIAN